MTLKEKLETIKGEYKNYSFNMSIVNEYHDCEWYCMIGGLEDD
jgi:hypothetical protein